MNSYKLTKHFLSFSQKLFFSIISLFMVFVICFIGYQYQREKSFKIDQLNTKLQVYNNYIHKSIKNNPDNIYTINSWIESQRLNNLRITIINYKGKVLYDSSTKDYLELDNHSTRKEVKEALDKKIGYDVRRVSKTTGIQYFYSATRFDNYIVRSALPYSMNLTKTLKADSHYLWFALIFSIILILIFYKFTHKLGTSINKLREFAVKADQKEMFEIDKDLNFPHNELGEISEHIIKIYKRLHKTKEALYIEKEKLITHLQISQEGLGIFDHEKNEILVNNLFIQYTNLIADSSVTKSGELFSTKEFEPVVEYIDKNLSRSKDDQREARLNLTINKNGHIFSLSCIVFDDKSFEISINDRTDVEERIRMKRELTQNIAHELKTPVSSIQGYLETIVTNELPEEKREDFLQKCYAQSNRLSNLLQDISIITRMDEASNLIKMEQVNITQLCQNIINELSLRLEEKQIQVFNSIDKEVIIHGNYSLVYSIFRNLFDNTIAYAGNNIEIHLSCFRENEDFYYFDYYDTGIGVSNEHLNRLFERFYRIDKGRSRKLGGTGLGLAIVKNAVLMHRGNISAKTTHGKGLEFIFTLAKK